MTRWYHAESDLSERWTYAGESREAAIKDGRSNYGGFPFAIAPEEERTDSEFFAAFTRALFRDLEHVDECLAEEGWIDFEDAYIDGTKLGKDLESKFREWLPSALERPKWRSIDMAEREAVEPLSGPPGGGAE